MGLAEAAALTWLIRLGVIIETVLRDDINGVGTLSLEFDVVPDVSAGETVVLPEETFGALGITGPAVLANRVGLEEA